MKKIVLSAWTVAALSSVGFAGGDMAPVEPVVSTPMMEEVTKNFYVGLGLTGVGTSTDDVNIFSEEPYQDRTGNLSLLAGYAFNPYIAVEGRYSLYVSEEDYLNTDFWGIYAKPQYPVTEDFTLYALLGFGGVTSSGTNGAAIDLDDTGFQWGLGASYDVADDIAVFVDYVSVADGMTPDAWNGATPDVSIGAITLGVTYSF
ncbi:MAG: hypothetical protein B7Y13_07420 [Sulfurovum sp. 24-42-9]|jgi:opacity protein-like surface antigen|nr:MAG: hypothetical protein B7Y13_07420 [Sulfurovum sp. 24-42-9]HQS78177.1 porin family protein [Sulfurovum sp.]